MYLKFIVLILCVRNVMSINCCGLNKLLCDENNCYGLFICVGLKIELFDN